MLNLILPKILDFRSLVEGVRKMEQQKVDEMEQKIQRLRASTDAAIKLKVPVVAVIEPEEAELVIGWRRSRLAACLKQDSVPA